MSTVRPLNPAATVVVLVLCLSWALQQIAIKLALPEVGALTQGAIRTGAASLLVGVYVLWRKPRWMPGIRILGIVSGLLFGTEFMLLYRALEYTDAARTTMFLYTAPFVVAIGSHFIFAAEKLDIKSWIGIGIAFAGVVLALNPAAMTNELGFLGDTMALAAAIFWGFTTLLIKMTRLRECPASQVLLYQLIVCTAIFAVSARISGDELVLPLAAMTVAALVYQSVWVAAISYGIWFVLISRYSVTTVSVVTFVTPLFGVALGVLILGERARIELLFGAAAVALGILLVSLPRKSTVTS